MNQRKRDSIKRHCAARWDRAKKRPQHIRSRQLALSPPRRANVWRDLSASKRDSGSHHSVGRIDRGGGWRSLRRGGCPSTGLPSAMLTTGVSASLTRVEIADLKFEISEGRRGHAPAEMQCVRRPEKLLWARRLPSHVTKGEYNGDSEVAHVFPSVPGSLSYPCFQRFC